MVKKFPPRGYRLQDFPLPHSFEYLFGLSADDGDVNSFIATLFRASNATNAPDTIEVNPEHASFAEDTGCLVCKGSIVPKISVSIDAALTKAAVETDSVRRIVFNWMPIYTAFLPSLDAVDSNTGNQVEDILELNHNTTDEDVVPLVSAFNLTLSGNQPLSNVTKTEVFGDYNLSTDATLQAVAFDSETLFDGFHYYDNAGMLKKVTGPWRSVVLTRDGMYKFRSNNFTQPMVKRANKYTFCGILFHVGQAGTPFQLVNVADTTAVNHVRIAMKIRFDEWNPTFDQTVI